VLRKKYEAKVTTLTDKIRARRSAWPASSRRRRRPGLDHVVVGRGDPRRDPRQGSDERRHRRPRDDRDPRPRRSAKEKEDVARAEENVDVLKGRLDELQVEIADAIGKIQGGSDASALEVLSVKVAPRKGDLSAGTVCLAWVPHRVNPDGTLESVA
jgi:hypothetical protein